MYEYENQMFLSDLWPSAHATAYVRYCAEQLVYFPVIRCSRVELTNDRATGESCRSSYCAACRMSFIASPLRSLVEEAIFS